MKKSLHALHLLALIVLISAGGMRIHGEGWESTVPPVNSAATPEEITWASALEGMGDGPSVGPIAPELQSAADGLAKTAAEWRSIFDWVRNNVEYTHYFGSRKGPQLTYLEQSGNDVDQCALLSALLRAKGIATKYLWTKVRVPISSTDGFDLQNWLNVGDAKIDEYLVSRGSPVTEWARESGNIVMRRMLVSAQIGGSWVKLDPSFKRSETKASVSLSSLTGFSAGAAANSAQGDAYFYETAANSWVSSRVAGLNTSALQVYLYGRTSAAVNAILQDPALVNKDFHEVFGGYRIASIQPATPFQFSETGTFSKTWTELPSAFFSTLTISHLGGSKEFQFAALGGRRLTIEFKTQDPDLIGQTVGIGDLQLWLDDAMVYSEGALGTQTGPASVTISVKHPHPTAMLDQSYQKSYRRDAKYAVIYAFNGSGRVLKARQRRAEEYRLRGLEADSREVLGESLNILGLTWMHETEMATRILGEIDNISRMAQHRLGRAGQETEGFFVDIGLQRVCATERVPGSDPKVLGHHLYASGLIMSALEHAVISQTGSGDTSVSTASLLGSGADGSIARVTAGTWATQRQSAASKGYRPDQIALLDQMFPNSTVLSTSETANPGLGGVSAAEENFALLPWNAASGSYTGLATYQVGGSTYSVQMRIGDGFHGGYASGQINVNEMSSSYRAAVDWVKNLPPAVPPARGGDPVDLASGHFTLDIGGISIGNALPLGIAMQLNYHGARRLDDDSGLGAGWTHSLHGELVRRSNYEKALGAGSAQEGAGAVAAIYAVRRLCDDLHSAKNALLPALAANYLANLLTNNAASFTFGDTSVEFLKQPSGAYLAPRGSTLSYNGIEVTERHGNTFVFQGSNFNAGGRVTSVRSPWLRAANFTYDANDRLTEITDAFGRKLTFNYDLTTGLLKAVVDSANNRRLEFEYSADKDLVKISDPDGRSDSFTYDASHRMVEQKDGLGRTIVKNTVFDSNDRVVEQQSQGLPARTWKYRYGPRMTSVIDPLGGTEVHVFDERMRPIAITDEMGRTTRMAYDGQDHLVSVIDPLGKESVRTYDGASNLTSTKDALGKTELYHYDSRNRLDWYEDKNGKRTLLAYNDTNYNGRHQPASITTAEGEVTQYTYDTYGRALTMTPPGSGSVSYTIDNFDRVTRVTHPVSGFQEFRYDGVGNLRETINAKLGTTTSAFNKSRQVVQTTVVGGGQTSVTDYTYDAARNLINVADPKRNVTEFEYSPTGKLLSTKLPGGGAIYQQYDERDWPVRIVNPLGDSAQISYFADGQPQYSEDARFRRTYFGYDGAGRQNLSVNALGHAWFSQFNDRGELSMSKDGIGALNAGGMPSVSFDADSGTTSSQYDDKGNLRYRANRRSKTWEAKYDGSDRLIETISPEARHWTQKWKQQDPNRGVLEEVKEPSSEKIVYQYDTARRLQNKLVLDASGNVLQTHGYSYDVNSNLETVTGGAASIVRSYDSRNRITSYRRQNSETIQYKYDLNDNLETLTYPLVNGSRAVTYSYDSRDRLVKVSDWANRVTTFQWDDNDRLRVIKRPNLTERRMEYWETGELKKLEEVGANGSLIFRQDFVYDGGGRISTRTTTPIGASYAEPGLSAVYDGDDRMVEYGTSASNRTALQYDLDGNLLAAPLPSGPWGANGVSAGDSGEYGWDALNRLTSVKRNGIQAAAFTYDVEGFLENVTAGGAATRLVVDPHGGTRSQVLERVATNGDRTRAVYGLGLLYEERPGGSLRYYHYDYLGSTVALTDQAGSITGTARYGIFGAIYAQTGDILTTPFLWEGRHGVWTDKNSGLVGMRARWYHTQLRRFLNPDPAGFSGGANFYAFADGNPISFIDPFGLGAEAPDGYTIKTAVQMVLTAASFVPGVGVIAGGINALIYAGDGDTAGALGSIMPGGGYGSSAAASVRGGFRPVVGVPRIAESSAAKGTASANRIMGERAVDDFIAHAEANGFEVVGREVTFRTPFGNRRLDVVLRNLESGAVGGIEIKSTMRAFKRFDKAARQQFSADRWINTHGAEAVGQFEGLRIDNTLKMLWKGPK